jgi:hypothetical protein
MPIPSGYFEQLLSDHDRAGAEAIWTFIATESLSYTVLPDGRCDVILHFDSDLQRNSIKELSVLLVGPATMQHRVPMRRGSSYVGVRLKPGIAGKMLGIDLSSIANHHFSNDAALHQAPALIGLGSVEI